MANEKKGSGCSKWVKRFLPWLSGVAVILVLFGLSFGGLALIWMFTIIWLFFLVSVFQEESKVSVDNETIFSISDVEEYNRVKAFGKTNLSLSAWAKKYGRYADPPEQN